MSDISLTILPETPDDAPAIDHLNARTFGPGRFAKTPYRIREEVTHIPALSFTARVGTLLVGSVRLSPILIGKARALLLGPLTVEPPFRDRGIGQALIARALEAAEARAIDLVVLVGDEPYYGQGRLQAHRQGPGHHDRAGRSARLLIAELVPGAFDGVKGAILPDWATIIQKPRSGVLRRGRVTGPPAPRSRPSAPTRSSRPSRPANIGSTPMPRTTLASRIFRPSSRRRDRFARPHSDDARQMPHCPTHR